MPEFGRSPEEGNGNSFQYSCLENSVDKVAWQATYSPWGHVESNTNKHTQEIASPLLQKKATHFVYYCL